MGREGKDVPVKVGNQNLPFYPNNFIAKAATYVRKWSPCPRKLSPLTRFCKFLPLDPFLLQLPLGCWDSSSGRW